MLLNCTNKGCYAQDEHILDETQDKVSGGTVICIKCGEKVDVPRTTKVILKSLGQIRRETKTGLLFSCSGCGVKDKPVLKKIAGKDHIAVCRACSKPLNIHPSFIEALKVIKTNGSDGEDRVR